MAETQENPILAFFSNLLRGIKPPQPKNDTAVAPANVTPDAEQMEKKPAVAVAVSEDESANTSLVTFPRQEFAPMKLETDSVEAEPSTNPILLWQLIAVILKHLEHSHLVVWGSLGDHDYSPPTGAETFGGEFKVSEVYAIGGFFILRWAWTRWNERKGSKKSDDEPPTDPNDL